jgi:hypothetical protein
MLAGRTEQLHHVEAELDADAVAGAGLAVAGSYAIEFHEVG